MSLTHMNDLDSKTTFKYYDLNKETKELDKRKMLPLNGSKVAFSLSITIVTLRQLIEQT